MIFEDIICAPATSVGTGAISMIRVSGNGCLPIVDSVIRFKKGSASASMGYVLKRGDVEGLDDVVVGIYRAPNSYTGEDSAEICCHASSFVVSSLIARLCDAGCRLAEAGEFTRRAFINGKMDLAQAEAVADMISSTSQAQHKVALNQLRGGYSAELGVIRAKLLELTSLLELELDFSEEDLEFADRSRLIKLVGEAYGKCSALADSFRLGNAIRNGVPVAIIGSPNSGKSTLLNALLRDDRAIVSDVPGTTRDTIEETCVLCGVLYRFIDTAGIRESSDEVESMGIARSFDKASKAEIILGVVDASAKMSSIEQDIRRLLDIRANSSGKLVILLNKVDILPCNKNVIEINNLITSIDNQSYISIMLSVSAKNGYGLEDLGQKLSSLLDKPSEDAVLVTNIRHYQALKSASESLNRVRIGLMSVGSDSSVPGLNSERPNASLDATATQLFPVPIDLLAEDLREAIRVLGSITGEITTDEVLGEIFGKFCVGK